MTLAERFIVAFRLPYAVGCFVVGTLLFGVFDGVLSRYAATSDLSQAVATAYGPVNLIVNLLLGYAFYAPRYMREKLAQAGVPLSRLLPDKEAGFRAIFARVAAPRPQVVTWLAFLALLVVAVSTSAILGTGPSPFVFNAGEGTPIEFVAGIFDLASYAVGTLALSSVVWTYGSISRGIHRFGHEPLELRPYYEDAFLGLKPLGSLALSLALAYFVFIGLLLLSLLGSPSTPTIGDIIGIGGFLVGLILVGLLLFFLPLNRLHRRMMRQKQEERDRLKDRLTPVFQEPAGADPSDDLAHLFKLDMMDRKVSSMALWPFDFRILGKLSVIALSITAILISRIIALILRI